ncbi:MAG TPA: PEP-utilizing enzyme [Polyangiaceae bacterium]|nr:PEP-utilizing enzyme [Polyangiaceae bacterium]
MSANLEAGAGETIWKSPVPGARWLRTWRLGEWLRDPLSPLFETSLLPILANGRESGGSGRLGVRMPRAWRVERPSYMVANGYFFARADPDRLSVLLLPPRFLFSELSGGWVDRWERRALPAYLGRLDAYRARAAAATPARALLSTLDELALDVAEVWYVLSLASGGAAPLMQFLRGACGRPMGDVLGDDHLVLYRGFRTKAVEAQQSAFRLVREALASPKIVAWLEENPIDVLVGGAPDDAALAPFRGRLLDHLEAYGHETGSLDFIEPTFAESPGPLAIALRCYMSPSAADPGESVERLAREREEATAKVRARLTGPRRALFDALLARAQRYAVAREDAVFFLQMGWPVFRRVLLELGRRLAADDVLDAPDDVFFLTAGELRDRATATSGGSLAAAVAERRELREARRSLAPPVRIPAEAAAWERSMRWPINLREIGAKTERHRSVLVGTAASPGRVRATARVLGFPSEFRRLRAGEVLVAVATTPSWTPLFSRAAAVVTDVGAISLHSSIVAREYGIPAVVGTQQATRAIRDGQVVTVDGTAGKVYLDEEPAPPGA